MSTLLFVAMMLIGFAPAQQAPATACAGDGCQTACQPQATAATADCPPCAPCPTCPPCPLCP